MDPQSPSPSALLVEKERRLELEEDLARLPDEYREVIRLARSEGLSHAEIGKHMGRSEVAARKLLSRAMARLVSMNRES